MKGRVLSIAAAVLILAGCDDPTPKSPRPENDAAASSRPTECPVLTGERKRLGGTINGVQVSGFHGFLSEGKFLTLFTGADPSFEFGTRLVLFTDLEAASDQSVRFDEDTGYGSWHIHVDSEEHESLSHMVMNGYRLEFITGTEQDFTVPASIRLTLEGEFPIRLEGTVDIKTSGLVSRNGVVDRGHDHLDTIEYVAQQHLMALYDGRELSFRDPQRLMMQNGLSDSARKSGQIQEGYYAAIYSDADGRLGIGKVQLAKEGGSWKVANELEPGQIHVAHPLNPPRREQPPYIYKEMAGKQFERTIYAEPDAWREIKEPGVTSCGGGQREGSRGYCKVAYGIYTDAEGIGFECHEVTYLFDQVDDRWTLSETLPEDKQFNFRTGEVEDRTQPPFGC